MVNHKHKRNVIIACILMVLCVLAVIVFYPQKKGYYPVSNARYPNFGIAIPDNYQIHGIDVSRYQGRVSWKMVKEMEDNNIRIGFVFIKATQGLSMVDPMFNRNWRESAKTGIIHGAYHYFMADKSGKDQARHFIDHVSLQNKDLPPVLDIEETMGMLPSVIRKNVAEWLQTIELYYKVKPIIYTNIHFYERYLAGQFDEYPLWIAHYRQTQQPRIFRPWTFWQHNEEGNVNGIASRVDFNTFNGDSADFKNLLIQTNE